MNDPPRRKNEETKNQHNKLTYMEHGTSTISTIQIQRGASLAGIIQILAREEILIKDTT